EALDVGLPQRRNRLPRRHQLPIPDLQLIRPRVTLEQRVALAQRPRVASPGRKKVWFHVEQPPVHESPPRLGAPPTSAWLPGSNVTTARAAQRSPSCDTASPSRR